MHLIAKIYKKLHWLIAHADERGEKSAGYWMRQVRQLASQLARQNKGKLLDVGCGEGMFLVALSADNHEIELYGIDLSEDQLKRAKDKLALKNITARQLSLADAANMPFPDNYFDTVVSLNLIFNLPTPEIVKKVFKEMSRVCKTQGKVIIDFRNARNPLLVLKYKLAPWYDPSVKDIVLNTYRSETICSWLEDAGLQVIKTLPVGFPLKAVAPIIVVEAEKK